MVGANTVAQGLVLAKWTGRKVNDVSASNTWDLTSFFKNATNYSTVAGGAFLGFIGIIAVVWGGFLLARKLMSGQQNQDSWLKIVALLLVGGGLLFGGIGLLLNFANGANKTVTDFGNGDKPKNFIDFAPQAEFIQTWLITKGIGV